MASKIVMRIIGQVKPGRVAGIAPAMVALQEHVAGEPGVLLYESYLDADGATFVAVEVYADEAALVGHMTNADLRPLLECVEINQLQVHGPVSASLTQMLGSVAPAEFFTPAVTQPTNDLASL